MRKIIVLTPIKNESWILDRFLEVTSIYADHIIIADQNSTDNSVEICSRYPKVILFENKSVDFNEADRQRLLISKARSLFGTENILLAIDADEILAADAMSSNDWQIMVNAQPGTILHFEKPTFFDTTDRVIRYPENGWPLGYVDDGAEHTPSVIHSKRIPTPHYANNLYLHNIKFLHYALTRLDAQFTKLKYYCMLENVFGSSSILHRRFFYNSNQDYRKEGLRFETSNPKWFALWESKNIDMHSIRKEEYYWYDVEILRLFQLYGVDRFKNEDIWNVDWEEVRIKLLNYNIDGIPDKSIESPSAIYLSSVNLCFSILLSLKLGVNRFRQFSKLLLS
ncbi:glycosyltransferase family 2 protein [Algoriphagus chordae]|uniref:Glycosyl transferase family 2 n=1 Tax=Algoriphagus chordae TaxID=237019 RepID=A0A2W7QY95_9BACT|nr:glycosyltransferase family 2 protein [Algoriphagus chordae]PZX52086.1 glycosyl transferase family 2 [Algoriphagus chordae]